MTLPPRTPAPRRVERPRARLYNRRVRASDCPSPRPAGRDFRPPHPEVQPVQVTVSARHGHLDDDTQSQLQEKAEKLLTFFDRLTAIVVTVDLHKDRTEKTVGVEILAKASAVFGSKQEAQQWLERPATGLNQRRPIDLLATFAGVALVEDFLTRLEYGTYT